MHKRGIIFSDLDEVAADFDAGVIESWNRFLPNVKRIDSNKLKKWNFPDNYDPKYADQIKMIWREKGFFRNLKPIDGAVQAINEMMEEDYKVFFCSTPTTREPYCMFEKLEWVYQYFGSKLVDDVIFSKDKTVIFGDYLIDDKPVITGEKVPVWKQIFFDRGRLWGKGITVPKLSDWTKWREIIK